MDPILAAVLIAKDEAHTIEKTIVSVHGGVDACFLLATGDREDRTLDTARAKAAEIGLPFFFRMGPFVDYASARNDALALAADDLRSATAPAPRYALSLSADETLHGGAALHAFLAAYDGEESAFLIDVRTPTGSFPYPRILRLGGPWRFEGAIHEEPRHRDDPKRVPTVAVPAECWITYQPTDSVRFARRLRERDLPLLSRQLRACGADSEVRARTLILLGRTREHLATITQTHNLPDGAAQEWFSAMGFYAIAMADETLPIEARTHATFKYLNVAETIGIVYTDMELVHRIAPIAAASPKDPALAYMLAVHTAAVNPREGLQAAYRAARLAREAVVDPDHPHDPHGLLWRPHLLAARCAHALGHKPAMKKSAEAGLAAGGPADVFTEFLPSAASGDAVAVAPAPVTATTNEERTADDFCT